MILDFHKTRHVQGLNNMMHSDDQGQNISWPTTLDLEM